MRLIDIFVMAAIPLAIGAALLIAAFSGRLSARTRARVQFALAAIVYPAAVVFFAWQALDALGEPNWSRALVYAGVAVIMAVSGLRLLRRRMADEGREPAR